MPAPIEPLESRTYFSKAPPILIVTVPNPLPTQEATGIRADVTIPVDVTDDGTGQATGKFPLSLYATSKGNFLGFAPVTKLVSVAPAEHFYPGQTNVIDVVVPSFPTSLDGSFFIAAEIEYTSNGYPDRASGVSTTEVDCVPTQPDLTGTFASVPTTAAVGKPFSVDLTVTNGGNGTASGALEVSFGLSNSSSGSDESTLTTIAHNIRLKAGKSEKIRFSLSIPSGTATGTQFLVADIDPSDVFSESDLANKQVVSADTIKVSS